MKQQHIFLAFSRPKQGREKEFREWYDRYHLRDVVNLCPGFERGFRAWAIDDRAIGDPLHWPSLAVYELRGDDVAMIHRQVSESAKQFTPSDGVFEDDHVAWVYSPLKGNQVQTDVFGDQSLNHDGSFTVLAFGDDLTGHKLSEASQGEFSIELLEANAHQRGQISLPWQHLVKAVVNVQQLDEVTALFADSLTPAAMRIYRQVGPMLSNEAPKTERK